MVQILSKCLYAIGSCRHFVKCLYIGNFELLLPFYHQRNRGASLGLAARNNTYINLVLLTIEMGSTLSHVCDSGGICI